MAVGELVNVRHLLMAYSPLPVCTFEDDIINFIAARKTINNKQHDYFFFPRGSFTSFILIVTDNWRLSRQIPYYKTYDAWPWEKFKKLATTQLCILQKTFGDDNIEKPSQFFALFQQKSVSGEQTECKKTSGFLFYVQKIIAVVVKLLWFTMNNGVWMTNDIKVFGLIMYVCISLCIRACTIKESILQSICIFRFGVMSNVVIEHVWREHWLMLYKRRWMNGKIVQFVNTLLCIWNSMFLSVDTELWVNN